MKLRPEIESGTFKRETVAVSFGRVLKGNAPRPYSDAASFFQYTYPTDAIKTALSVVLNRVWGRGGDGVLLVYSGFGGGKTHLLTTIYYYLKEGEKARGTPIWDAVGGTSPPQTRLCGVDGVELDPWRTPLWGWVGECLGGLDLVKVYVDERRPPPAEVLRALFSRADKPVVLLIDELGEYFRSIYANPRREVQEKTSYFEGIVGFFRSLYEAMRDRDVLVVSVPDESAPYDDEVKRRLRMLVEVLKRVGREVVPVARVDEVYGIVKRRIFENIDERLAEKKVGEYVDFYDKFRHAFKGEWISAWELKEAFPFHPSFIRTLYERTSSIPAFQRTRDLIYVLAKVAHLQRGKKDFLMVSDVDLLGDRELKEFFTRGVDRPNYEAVIEHDIRMAREKSEKHYAVAVALYIYSLIGGDVKKSAADRATVRTLVARPSDTDPHIYDTVLDELLEFAWYIDADESRFWVSAEPNLNKMLYEEASVVGDDIARDIILEEVEKMAKKVAPEGFVPVVVTSVEDVKDERAFKLYVAAPPFSVENSEKINNVFDRAVYKNSMYFLLYSRVPIEEAKFVVACDKLIKALEGDRRERMRQICQGRRLNFYVSLYRSYDRLAYPTSEGLKEARLNIELSDVVGDPDRAASKLRDRLANAVKKALTDRAKYMEDLDAEFFYDIYLRRRLEHLDSVDVKMIEEDFYRDPDLPALPNVSMVKRALKKLADEGKIFLSCGGKYYGKGVPESLLCDYQNAITVLKELPPDVKPAIEPPRPPVEEERRPSTCVEVEWPNEKGFEAEVVEVEGDDTSSLSRFLQQLETLLKVKPREVSASAILEDEGLQATFDASTIEGVKRLARYLSSVERGAKVKFRVKLAASFPVNDDAVMLFNAFKKLNIRARGKRC